MAFLLQRDPQNVVWSDQAARVEADRAELYLDTGAQQRGRQALTRARTLLPLEAGSPLQLHRRKLCRVSETWKATASPLI